MVTSPPMRYQLTSGRKRAQQSADRPRADYLG